MIKPARGIVVAAVFWIITGAALANNGDAERGRIVEIAAGCSDCHISPDGTPFAGGALLGTPFGAMASPNITPDPNTGIGTWSFEDFDAALRHGTGKDGAPLYPVMPYTAYTKMSDTDLRDLWAYLQTVKPVAHEVEVNRLPFPFDVRANLDIWQAMFFEEGRYAPDPDRTEEENRGAYLVDALGHCGACHTPRNSLGGPLADQYLKGGPIDQWYAPDISNGPDSIIADWDEPRIAAALTGSHPDGTIAVGKMATVVEGLSQLPSEDVDAIAAYLNSLAPEGDGRARPTVAVDEAVLREREGLFEANCASCHHSDGTGKPGLAASLVGSGAVLAQGPENVISVVLEGIAPRGDYGVMPSFADTLSDREIAALANHVRTSWGNDAPANATPGRVAGLRRLTGPVADAVERAIVCPNVPAANVDETLREALAGLADSGSLDSDVISRIAGSYRERLPDIGKPDRFYALTGLYCQAVARQDVKPSEVLRQQIAFMNALGDEI